MRIFRRQGEACYTRIFWRRNSDIQWLHSLLSSPPELPCELRWPAQPNREFSSTPCDLNFETRCLSLWADCPHWAPVEIWHYYALLLLYLRAVYSSLQYINCKSSKNHTLNLPLIGWQWSWDEQRHRPVGPWWKTLSGTENKNRLTMMPRELQYLCRNKLQSDLFIYLFLHSTLTFFFLPDFMKWVGKSWFHPIRATVVVSRLWKTIQCLSRPTSSAHRHGNAKVKRSIKSSGLDSLLSAYFCAEFDAGPPVSLNIWVWSRAVAEHIMRNPALSRQAVCDVASSYRQIFQICLFIIH